MRRHENLPEEIPKSETCEFFNTTETLLHV